jgi:1,4-alpha-glucan branching enzyme
MPRIANGKATEFKLYAPQAKKVSIAGSFNNWDTKKFSAKKDNKGNWMVKVSLKPGKYEYKFYVDGSWWNDPTCTSCIQNAFGGTNCLVEVR